jgi:hypothetical protein
VRSTVYEALRYEVSPLLCYLFPFRSKYSHQHPILKQPQPTFLPQCQRPSFTPIPNNFHMRFLLVCRFVWVTKFLIFFPNYFFF